MFKMIAAGLLAITVVACSQSTKQYADAFDTAVQNNLPAACKIVDTAYASFTIVAATGDVKPLLVMKVNSIYAGAKGICGDPASVNSSTALVKLAQAYADMRLAEAQAKAAL